MACDIYASGRVVLVVWGRPQLKDLPRVERAVKGVHESFGPVVFIARVPSQAAPPDDYVRTAISELLLSFTELCLSYHAVFEGGGFVAAAKRTALATIFLMMGKRQRYHVHASCEDVPTAVPVEHRPEVRTALQEFRTRGLLRYNLNTIPPEEEYPRAEAS